MENINSIKDKIFNKDVIINYFIKLFIAIIIIIISYIIAIIVYKKIMSKINDIENKNNKHVLYVVIAQFSYSFIIIIGVLSALSTIGFQINTILIIFGTLGITLALALQGTLSMIVSGIFILLFNYFKINDYVISSTARGTVIDFNLYNTTISHQNKILIVPNNIITNSVFENCTPAEDCYYVFDILLSNNNNIMFDVLMNNIRSEIIKNCKYVRDNNKIMVYVSDISNLGTNINVRIPIKNYNYVKVHTTIRSTLRLLLSDNKILLLDRGYLSNVVPKFNN